MSEWIGWVSRLRRTIYARLEELSFRTGAATVTGVLAVAATAIVLTITQGGHHAPSRSVFAGAVPSSLVVAPPMSAFPSATRSARHSHAAAPFAGYVPQPSPTRTRTRTAAPSASRPASWHPSWAASSPGGPGWPYPSPSPFPWPPG